MARKAREKSPTGIYHVCLKGDGNRIIFDDDLDRYAMMDLARLNFSKCGIRLGAWCLMSNHAHFLIDDPNGCMDSAMQSLMTSYARRYNRRTGHKGHVFQDRYWSSPITSDQYLQQAIKYIHLNPQRAGICPADEYRWSSYREYIGEDGYIDKAFPGIVFDGPDQFKRYTLDATPLLYRPTWRRRIDDDDVVPVGEAILRTRFGITRHEVQDLLKGRRAIVIQALKDAGFSVEQTQRLTGLGEWTIRKARQEYKKRANG